LKIKEFAADALDALLTAGADKAQTTLSNTEKIEMNIEAGKINLVRTTFDTHLHLVSIKDQRKGNILLNEVNQDSLKQAVNDVLEISKGSAPDPAHDIAEMQEPKTFIKGKQQPDMDRMYLRLKTFATMVKELFPRTILQQAVLDFTRYNTALMNSNGVDFTVSKGLYNFSAVFTSKDGEDLSSMNYSGFSTLDLNKELLDYGSLRALLKQSGDEIKTQEIKGKFVGKVIITPDCLGDFLNYLLGISLYDTPLISGSSIFKNKLNQLVASPKFTLHSRPVSAEIADGYFITGDGYEAQNCTIIEQGILKTFLLSLYGANKTGLERAVNSGGSYIVEPGDKSLNSMIKGVKRGILLSRFSGGNPSQNGNFSGVAKNSYYIEDGAVKYPLSETMISGNLVELFQNITEISQECVNFGFAILPWIASTGVTISGK
jgi:PmbA protein